MPVSGAAPVGEPDAASNALPEESFSSEGQGSAIQPARSRSLEEESAFSAAEPDGGCNLLGWVFMKGLSAKCTKPL
jgi:hypothetical protein